jgi:3-oxoacyl-[acyl-carrier-protein] synthase II
MKRVVITGLGALTPIGNNLDTFWASMKEGKSGAARITKFDPGAFRTHFACELKDFDVTAYLDRGDIKRTDPFTQYALIATDEAIRDSGIDFNTMDPFDTGVIWGSGQGGMLTFEEQVIEYAEGGRNPRFSPFFIPKLITNMASGMISMRHKLMGINYTTVSACSTSNTALMDAFNYIRWGKAKVIISGGSEAPITEASFGGFSAIKAMSTRNDDPAAASRPFDRDRDGFVMGEGAGALVLEELGHAVKRGAKIYAEVVGAASTADAYHMTATHPEGLGALRGMQLALEDAGMNASDVDYMNAHATSTPVGDISEVKAMQKLFGSGLQKVLVSSTKSMTGHLMGAAGAAEAIACIMAIHDGVIPATINTQNLDEQIPPDMQIVTGSAIDHTVNLAMSNTFGFGGHNGIVLFRKFDK